MPTKSTLPPVNRGGRPRTSQLVKPGWKVHRDLVAKVEAVAKAGFAGNKSQALAEMLRAYPMHAETT